MKTKNNIKLSVSPIIYNNGNRIVTLKLNNKEVYFMYDNFIINDELKKLLVSDEEITKYFIIALLHSLYKSENPKEHEYYNYDEFNAYKGIIKDDSNLKANLSRAFSELINNDMINSVVNDYQDLALNEAKSLVYSLSRLLYLQDKYKDSEIGQQIDAKIKEWLGYIKTYDEKATMEAIDPKKEQKDKVEYEKALNKMSARVLYLITEQYNLKINNSKYHTPFMDLWNYNVLKMDDLKEFLANAINNVIDDSKTYKRYTDKINNFINDLQTGVNMANFNRDKEDLIKEIRAKYNVKSDKEQNYTIPKETQDAFIEEITQALMDYENTDGFNIQDNDDVKKWRDKADKYIKHISEYQIAKDELSLFTMDYMLRHLAYSDYQLKEYKLNIDDEIKKVKVPSQDKEIKKDNKLLQATSKQLKAIDNARGGLVTYNETDTQALKNAIKEKQESLKNTHIKQDKAKLKQEIDKLKSDLVIAEQKEDKLKAEYKNVCDYLENIYKSMANEPKTSSYYKDLKRAKKQQEQRKKEIERIIRFNGWQLDLWGNGSYELVLNKRQKESLKLTIENLSKQIAKYTKEEQDIFDFLISKYLHNTDIKEIKFTLREYEETKKRVRPTNYLMGDIQAIRLLFREVWTYYTTSDKSYTFNEEHLFTKLNIKGELESDLNNLNNANLDTEISLEPTETLQNLLQDHDNYLYISTSLEIMQLNNDNEYLAKRLLKYLNYLARVNKKSVLNISLDTIIEELQHYGLKKFNMLDRHKTYKTEIVDVIDKTLSILEGENHLNKRFIEVLDRQPFINYDNEYRGKSQETSINEWGKHKIKIKVFDLDDTKLLETKQKQSKKKHKATKK